MDGAPSTSSETVSTIGTLCFRGDWACIHDDLVTLHDIAESLAEFMPEPLHCALLAFADSCTSDPRRAATLWPQLKEQLFRAAPGPQGGSGGAPGEERPAQDRGGSGGATGEERPDP